MTVCGRLMGMLLMASIITTLHLARCKGPDSQGKEFILGFSESFDRDDTDVQVYISTSSNTRATVTVTMPIFDSDFNKTFTVSRGDVQVVTFPSCIRGSGIGKSSKSVWIQSTEEISVYALIIELTSTDAYLVLPVDTLGQNYYAITFNKNPFIMLFGVEDITTVDITLPATGIVSVIYEGVAYGNGATLTVTLNRFEAFQLIKIHSNADFTGAHVTSDKRISVISGNKFPPVAGSASLEHMTQMLPPVETWGASFVSVHTAGRNSVDIYRIVASEDDTIVVFSGTNYTLTSAGDFQQFHLPTPTVATIASTKPVMVVMFSQTYNSDRSYGGDSTMTLVIPTPQYATDYTWTTVSSLSGEFINFITVVIEDSQKLALEMNGDTISWTSEIAVGGSTLVQLWTSVPYGYHNIYHCDPTVTFMAVASGLRAYDSYSYQAGMRLAAINGVCNASCTVAGDGVDNDCDNSVDEETLNGIDDDGDGEVDEDLASPAQVDGHWGLWYSWGNCPQTCAADTVRIRTRKCDSPAPANNGLDCEGLSAEGVVCDDVDCPGDGQWGQWGYWGSCSLTCGGTGFQIRDRHCDSPVPGPNGRKCTGDSLQTGSCPTGHCPVDGEWSPWKTWGCCSVTCGEGGVRTRTRTCDYPTPAFGGDYCHCNSADTVSCSPGPCPMDGEWGAWRLFGSCFGTYDNCLQKRTRPCNNPGPQDDGDRCEGICSEVTECGALVCHQHNEIPYVKNRKTCEISGGQVNTFTGVEGSFDFTCLFEAARLYTLEVRRDYYLSLNIYAKAMDLDTDGNAHVSNVTVTVIEKYHTTVKRTATVSITASVIRDVFNEPSGLTAAEDLWVIIDPHLLHDDYMWFGYENGMVTLSVKQHREKAAPIEVLTYQPYIKCMDMNTGLVISAELNTLPTPRTAEFPTTLCSTVSDHSAFAGSFHNLATDLQRVLFAMLDQNLTQTNADCSAAVTAFSACSTDAFKKDAVENCYTVDLKDLNTCIDIYCYI